MSEDGTGTAFPIKDEFGNKRYAGVVKYVIYGQPGRPGSLSRDDTRQKIKLAFEKWEKICNFTFQEVSENHYGNERIDISFNFVSDTGGSVTDNRLAVCRRESMKKVISFDDDVLWVDARPDTRTISPWSELIKWLDGAFGGRADLLSVACHEIGHALGLGHSTDPQSIMVEDLTGKSHAGYMDSRELGRVDAVALGRIYNREPDFGFDHVEGVDHYYWVGGATEFSSADSKEVFREDPDLTWGQRTLWKALLFKGYTYGKNHFIHVYAYLEPGNSPNIEKSPDVHVACGGWTQANHMRWRRWGLQEEPGFVDHIYAKVQTFADSKDRPGDCHVLLERLSELKRRPNQHDNATHYPWSIYGGLQDTRNLTSTPDTSVSQYLWGRQDGHNRQEIASFRTFYDGSKKYENAYGRAVLLYN